MALIGIMSLVQPAAAARWESYLPSRNLLIVRHDEKTRTYWFGTDGDGLWKYDGQQWEHIIPMTDRGTVVKQITSLAIGKKDTLWLGNSSGLFGFHVKAKTLTQYNASDITALFVDVDEALWYGTIDGYIGKKAGAGWSKCSIPEGAAIKCIVQDDQRRMYFGTGSKGVYFLNSADSCRWEKIIEFAQSPGNLTVHAIAIDRQGNKWLGTDEGVCLLDRWDRPVLLPDKSNLLVKCLTPSNSGLVHKTVNAIWVESFAVGDLKWFGTSGGISVLDSTNRRWKSFDNQNSGLTSNEVSDIVGDGDGNLWVALLDFGGVSKLNSNWSELKTNDGLSSNFVRAIERDRLGRLWVGTSIPGDVEVLEGGAWKKINLDDATCNQVPLAHDFLPNDHDTTMWIATAGCGIFRVSKNLAVIDRINQPALRSYNVLALAARGDTLWAGTDQGLIKLLVPGKKVIREYLVDRAIITLAQDLENRLWIGTNRGLYMINGTGEAKRIDTPLGSNAAVTAIDRDLAGVMWVGTNAGLARGKLDGDQITWTTFSTADGLPANNIAALGVAPNGTVWAGTLVGAAAYGNGKWIPYMTDDELCRRFRIVQIAFGPADVVWFATEGCGIARYRKTGLLPDTYIINPLQVVTTVNVTVQFSGYDFKTPPEELRFEYALDDTTSWQLAASAPTAASVTLPNVENGMHTFYVRAIDQDGNVDSTAAILRFNKVSPNWGRAITLIDPALGPQVDSLWLYLPPAVLPEGSSIRVNPVTVDTNAVAKQDPSLHFTGIAFALALQPENDSFATQRPISLKIFYDDSSVAQKSDQTKLAIYRHEGRWVPLGGTVGAEPPVIATTITQLDTFALFEISKGAIHELANTDLSNLAAQPRILSPQYASTMTISFDLGKPAEVTAKIYNLAGRFVQVLCEDRPMNPGSNEVEWNGNDYNGEHCPSGLYIICVQANGQTATKTVMVVNRP